MLGMGLVGLSTVPDGVGINVTVYDPTGNDLADCSANTDTSCSLPTLSASGTYTLAITPQSSGAANVDVLLSNPLMGVIATDGSSTVFNSTRVGQNGVYTFSATAGNSLDFTVSDVSLSGGISGVLLNPSGGYQTGFAIYGSLELTFNNLVAGNYTILLSPMGATTGSLSMALAAP